MRKDRGAEHWARVEANFKLALGERGEFLPAEEWDERLKVFAGDVSRFGFGVALQLLYQRGE